jgi:hypothetical protein
LQAKNSTVFRKKNGMRYEKGVLAQKGIERLSNTNKNRGLG